MSKVESEASDAIGFPGQGAPHEPERMKRLLTEYPQALEVVTEAEDILHRPLLPLLLHERGPESNTRDNQVRLYLGSSALWLTAESEGIVPNGKRRIFFGASAGEYAAMMAAGFYDFRTGLEQIDIRGQEMQKANELNPGAMLTASGMPFEEAEQLASIFEGVHAVNDNPGTQTVFSGNEVSLREMAEYLASAEAWSHVRLDWPAIREAAHHPIHMAPAVEGVRKALKKARMSEQPLHEFIGNRARPINSARAARRHLASQLTSGVLLRKSAIVMRDEYGVDTFVDVGPGKVLYTQMLYQFRKSVNVISLMDKLLPERS